MISDLMRLELDRRGRDNEITVVILLDFLAWLEQLNLNTKTMNYNHFLFWLDVYERELKTNFYD